MPGRSRTKKMARRARRNRMLRRIGTAQSCVLRRANDTAKPARRSFPVRSTTGLDVIGGSALRLSTANKVNLVSVRVADVGAVVVRAEVWAETWRPIIYSTDRKGSRVRGIHRCWGLSCECDHGPVAPARWKIVVRPTNPEYGFLARALPRRPVWIFF